MMRIAYLTGTYPRATDTFIQREVAVLRQKGAEVHTFSVRRPSSDHLVGEEQQSEFEKTYYILPANPATLAITHLKLLGASPVRYWQGLSLAWKTRQPGLKGIFYQMFYFLEAGSLACEVQHRQIQHLHNHIAASAGTVAMLAATLGGFSFSFTLHGPYIFFEPHRWHLSEKIRRALFVCCISHFCRSQGMVFAPQEKWNHMHIVHCGVDPALFQPKLHQGMGNQLLFVGRLAAEKGVPVLLDSLVQLTQEYPDLVLTLVGDGESRADLEQKVATLGLSDRVRFLGYQSQTAVRQHIQASDVFVLPSFAEGVPVVLMEAMAAGIPVVSTQIAGISELVENGVSGYLVPPGDADVLAVRIKELIDNPDLRSKMGQMGQLKVEKDFNVYREGDRLHQILAQALNTVESN
jgi:colanic acid/amylovoran biosynthesis glycosyltransferase